MAGVNEHQAVAVVTSPLERRLDLYPQLTSHTRTALPRLTTGETCGIPQ